MKKHVSRRIHRVFTVKFPEELPKVRGAATRTDTADVHAILTSVSYWNEPPTLEAMTATRRVSDLALAVHALRVLRGGDAAQGEKLLLQAAANRDDWLVQYFVACGLTQILNESRSAGESPLAASALTAVDAVLEARPVLAHALAMKAAALSTASSVSDAAVDAIRQAQSLAPGRPDYAFIAFRVHMNRRDYGAARQALGPFISTAASPEIRDYARRLMTIAVQEERQAAERRDRALQASPPSANVPDESGPHGFTPVYRELQQGEQRVEGDLQRIDCTPTSTTLHVVVDGQPARFVGGRIDTLQFITYRSDLSGEIACARRVPPDRVLITFVATEVKGSRGFPVAIEFIPTPAR